MRFFSLLGAALLPIVAHVTGVELDPDSEASIKAATAQYARGLLSFYKGDASGLPKEDVGVFPKPPYYWWLSGASWGGLIEYTQLTGDASHVKTLTHALVANYGPNNDLLLPWKRDQEGNDDQAFWALSLMSALEYDFPNPDEKPSASYLEVVENCFNNIVPRWDLTSCNGGFKWQIYPENAYGWNYKNSISNGAVFALGARLARYTGNQTYADWAVKIWDWSKAVGLISDKYEVFDGTGDKENCTQLEHTQWSYNIGMYMHGAAVMYNYTNGDPTWKKHVSGFLDHSALFFKPYDNATDIMYELPCETGERGRASCNVDQLSFKAYLSRFLSKSAIMAPFTKDRVTNWLRESAVGAAKSCSGGNDGATCGSKWYTGSWDGTTGVGQQLSALEVTQALLTLGKQVAPRAQPQPGPEPAPPSTSSVVVVVSTPTATIVESKKPEATETPKASETPKPTDIPTASLSATSNTSAIPIPTVTEIPTFQNSTDAPPSLNATRPGYYEDNNTSSRGECNCSPKSTTTVYVPPSPPTTAQPIPTGNNGAAPPGSALAPPSSSPATPTSDPEKVFDGGAGTVKGAGVAILAGVFGAFLSGLL